MSRPDHRRRLDIVPLGPPPLPHDWLSRLGRDLERRFPVRSRLAEPMPLRAEWRDDSRGQYRSDLIVDALIDRSESAEPPSEFDAPGAPWLLGITGFDLFAPERDFVFGEATVGGRWALISLHRLRPAAAQPHAELLYRRALTEAVHELGHLPGLDHCDASHCVMHPSRTATDVDAKETEFCAACAQTLDRRRAAH